jgi:hypothetical protein
LAQNAGKTRLPAARLLRVFAALIVLAGFACLAYISYNSVFRRWTIVDSFRSGTIAITASARFAGAISSLTWNGVEVIDSSDHGRELQSALHLNGLGECYNPTEAGAASDWFVSSSRLLSISARDNTLQSRSRMAFWVAPGKSSRSCPHPKNTTALSDHELIKTVTMTSNVIAHDVTFQVPRHYDSAIFEVLTAYLPDTFNTFWTYDPRFDELKPLSDGPGEQPYPVIISTEDRRFALGVYSQDLPQPSRPRGGYGRWRFKNERVTKWNCVFRARRIQPGARSFRCYTIVGNVDDVRAAMRELARQPR